MRLHFDKIAPEAEMWGHPEEALAQGNEAGKMQMELAPIVGQDSPDKVVRWKGQAAVDEGSIDD